MTDLKWIKFDFRIFDSAEFKYLALKNDGANLQLAWIRMICEAAKQNAGGRIYMIRNKKITFEELGALLGVPVSTAETAVKIFEELGWVKNDAFGLCVLDWGSYIGDGFFSEDKAEIDPLGTADGECEEKRRTERHREAQRRYREKKRIYGESIGGDNQGDFGDRGDNNAVTGDNRGDFGDKCVISRGDGSVIIPPKNIFIEENRIEESRIEDKREDEIRKDEKINNILSPSLVSASHGIGGTQSADAAEMRCAEESSNASLTLAAPAASGEKKEKNIKKVFGRFNNVYLYESEFASLKEKYGETLTELINSMSEYIKSSGKDYKDHFAALIRWGKNKYAPKAAASGEKGGKQESFSGAYDASVSRAAERHDSSFKDGWENMKTPQESSCGENSKYGFDPWEAFRIAIERSNKL